MREATIPNRFDGIQSTMPLFGRIGAVQGPQLVFREVPEP